MKKILSVALAVLVISGVTACRNQSDGDKNDANITNTVKDSVIIAIGSEPETLDPTKGWGHGNSPIIQSTLVKYNAELNFENDLATGYELSEDGLTWTFTIRDDAFFTDGEKVTAQDVAFTLGTAKAANGSFDLTYMESAVAQDDTTVVITLSKPTSIFLNTLASVGIVPEHAYGDDYGTKPIGSGPYKLVEWRPQEQLMFTANENYYGGVPEIKNVTVVFMSEDAALAAVQAGQVDVAYTVATLATTKVKGYSVESIISADNRGFTLPVLPNEGKTTEAGAPIGNNVTCNREIRQAIAYAIDRQQIADTVLNGFGRPAYSENDGMPWNNPDVKLETDVVTGIPVPERVTPQGTYTILEKMRNKTLRGDKKPDGTYEYETPVEYWMRVTWTGIGFHDAKWQTAFGGEIYKTRKGSHGCINMPPALAGQLYDMLQVGCPVVIHY